MTRTLTEQQLLVYARGPEKARYIIDNNFPDHYKETFKKLQDGQKIMWNWSAFFSGMFWFMAKKMPVSFIVAFLSTLFLEGLLLPFFHYYSIFIALGISSLLIGLFGEKLLIKYLIKKIKRDNFDDLSKEEQSVFLEKIGMTEHQYLSCIYGEANANTLMQYNVPNHYRKAFSKFAQGKKFVWNWAAGNGGYWFLYRKMPGYALIVLLLSTILSMWPLRNIAAVSKAILLDPHNYEKTLEVLVNFGVLAGLIFLIFLLSAIFANCLLINCMSKQIHQGHYPFLSSKNGEKVLVWIAALLGILFTALYQIISYIYNLETLIIERSVLSVIPFIITFVYMRYKMRAWEK